MKCTNKFQSAFWATWKNGALLPKVGKLPISMAKSDATALQLLFDDSSDKPFGASLIRFAAGEKVALHTHVGSHILIITHGTGNLTYNESVFPLEAGMLYLVPSMVPHAIEASSELVMIALGNDFRLEESEDRLELVGGNNE